MDFLVVERRKRSLKRNASAVSKTVHLPVSPKQAIGVRSLDDESLACLLGHASYTAQRTSGAMGFQHVSTACFVAVTDLCVGVEVVRALFGVHALPRRADRGVRLEKFAARGLGKLVARGQE